MLWTCEENCSNTLSNENFEQRETLKTEYDKLYEDIAKGAIITSKATWYEKGEKSIIIIKSKVWFERFSIVRVF